MIKAVIFDLDGTLVAFKLDVNACRTAVISRLAEQGFPRDLFSMKETAFDMLVKVKKYITAQGIEDQNFANLKTTVFSIVERFELAAARTTEMFPGIPETLKALRDMNLKLALCTISGEKAAGYILNRFNLEHFFDAVIPRESVSEVKPNPVHLEAALTALQVKPHEAVLVGDSVKDVACANHLKVLAVGVTTGLSSTEELTRSGAHYIASSASEIPKLILQLNKQAL
jgi:phosphoglycolate phosphatase-like HAD superfamily hydrolase